MLFLINNSCVKKMKRIFVCLFCIVVFGMFCGAYATSTSMLTSMSRDAFIGATSSLHTRLLQSTPLMKDEHAESLRGNIDAVSKAGEFFLKKNDEENLRLVGDVLNQQIEELKERTAMSCIERTCRDCWSNMKYIFRRCSSCFHCRRCGQSYEHLQESLD